MATKKTGTSPFMAELEARGITRRSFLGFCAATAAALGLSEAMTPKIAQALEENSVIGNTSGALAPVLWLEGASCTGCTESFAQVDTPDVASVVLELLSLNYSETLSAGAGHSLEQARKQTIEAGGYILIYEGAIVQAWDGNALRIAEEKGTDILLETAKNAAAILAVGSCAIDGGWMAGGGNNPADATGVQPFLQKNADYDIPPIINIPACPVNPEWIIAVVVDYLLLGKLPELNKKNEPCLMFDQTIHDNCPRRGHFENGEFVYQYGSEEEAKGYCLYPLGCRGPQTKTNCPIVRWNRHSNWCVEAGAPCIGCAEANPNRARKNWVTVNAPFAKRFHNFRIGSFQIKPMTAALCVTALAAVCLGVHGFGMKVSGRTKGGAPYEEERVWNVKHPENPVVSHAMEKGQVAVEEKEGGAE